MDSLSNKVFVNKMTSCHTVGGGVLDAPRQLAVYYNPERTRQWASLPAGTWRKVSDGVHAGVTPFGPCFRDALELAPTSVTVLVAE